jgi:hypothetical protein
VAARSSIRVRGVTYSSPDEAYVAAAELEDNAETVATNLRRNGRDTEAEQVSDRARADAERLRTFARARESAEAGATPQPPDAPRPSPRSSSSPGRAGKGARGRSSTRRRGSSSRRTSSSRRVFTPRTRSIVVRTGIPRATSSATSLALQVVGLTLAVAFLTLLLTERGVSAFGELAGGAANGLRWLVDPVDPLAPRRATSSAASSSASGNAARPTATRTNAVRTVPLAVGVG